MKKLVVLLLLAACKPGSSGATPDPRFGVLFAQNDEVNAIAANQSANFITSDFAVDSQGTVHFIATWNPTREFGKTTPHFNSSNYWRVSKDGKVEVKDGPRYASAITDSLSVLVGSDDQPVLVQYDGLGAGKVISFFTFNSADSSWSEKPFYFSDRPDGVTAKRFGDTDQVRVLGGGQIVVEFQNHLLHSSADGWAELGKPRTAVDLRLVNADDSSVRVVWTEADNRLATGTYSRATWALDAAVVRGRVPGVPKLGANFNVAGSPQAFVVDLDVDAGWMTYRFNGTTLSRTDTNGVNPPARVPLLLTKHPTRAIRGSTTGVFLGHDVGPISSLVPGVIKIACPTDPNASPIPDTNEARLCSNRLVDLRLKPEPDLSGMVLVTFDRTQDIVTRGYVKHVPFPVGLDPFFGDAGVPSTFPGDDGGTDVGGGANETRVIGRALLVGESIHSRIQATLTSTSAGTAGEPLDIADDGRFTSSIVTPGAFQLALSATGFVSQTINVTVTQGTANVGDLVLDATGISATPFDPTATTIDATSNGKLYQLANGTMSVIDVGVGTKKQIGTNIATTPAPVFTNQTQNNDALLGWVSGTSTQYVSPGQDFALPNDGVSLADYRLMGTSAPVVATAPVDNVTPRTWKQQGTTLITDALEVAFAASNTNCSGAYKWAYDSAGDGGVKVFYRTNCTTGAFTAVTGPTASLPITVVPDEYHVLAFAGSSCGEAGGYVTPCPLYQMVNGASNLISDKVVDYRLPRLDRVGATGTAYTTTGTVAASNLSLPTHYAVGERPAYGFSGGPMLIRTTTGFTFVAPPRAPVLIDANIIRSFDVFAGVAFFTAAANATDCSAGCTLELLSTNADASLNRTMLMANANGTEQVQSSGTGFVAISARTWPECPGGPCSVIERSLPDAGLQGLTRASFAPLPALPVVKPLVFLRFVGDGGTPVPSTWKP